MSRSRAARVTAWAVGLAALAVVFYAVIVVAAGALHADHTDTLLWAEATWRSGRLFDPSFYYAATLPFGGQWFMLPFLPLFGFGMAAQTAGMILFACLLCGAIAWLASRALRFSPLWTAAAVALTVMAVSGSVKMRELYWGHIIYYSLGSLFLTVGLVLVTRWLESHPARDGHPAQPATWQRRAVAVCALVWIFLCSLNGLQGVITFGGPLLGALLLERFFHREGGMAADRDQMRIVLGCALATLAGLAVGLLLTYRIPTWYTDYYASLSDPDQWLGHLLQLPRDWLTLLGYAPAANTAVTSSLGLAHLARLPGALLLAVAPLLLFLLRDKIREIGVRLLLYAHLSMSGALLFAYVFGQIANVNWRLSPLAFTGALCTVALARVWWHEPRSRRFALVALAPLVLYACVAAGAILATPVHARQQNPYYRLGQFLDEAHLTRGYATFWNASSVSIQTDGRVRIAPVLLENGDMRPYRYQSASAWYQIPDGVDACFLLLDESEYQVYTRLTPDRADAATRVLTAPDGYFVLVFDENCVDPFT